MEAVQSLPVLGISLKRVNHRDGCQMKNVFCLESEMNRLYLGNSAELRPVVCGSADLTQNILVVLVFSQDKNWKILWDNVESCLALLLPPFFD